MASLKRHNVYIIVYVLHYTLYLQVFYILPIVHHILYLAAFSEGQDRIGKEWLDVFLFLSHSMANISKYPNEERISGWSGVL